ncbi:hypothetical protein [Pseudomonas protegens]|uniref:hypothetical protein n=1 Tax=Pseudomonas protegens TaxID=380021 RepID=UPI00215FC0F0|nr:hypothetical protein [Pseudomonas protegens]UVM13880.1 hypothetical protein LOY29_14745 [Pseudomonas protegens]
MGYFDFLHREFFNHQKTGAFKPNALFTRTVSDADLNPKGRGPFDLALPIHVHEYVHYLHNVSTPVGIMLLLNELELINSFVKGTDGEGRYVNEGASAVSPRSYVETYKLLMGGVFGDPIPQEAKNLKWSFSEPEVEDAVIHFEDDCISGLKKARVAAKAKSQGSTEYSISIELGLQFLTEGIAYEIDRSIRRKSGVWQDLDESTPAFPYLVYQPLIDFLIGRDSSEAERIVLGTCALLSFSPGAEFVRACATLRTGTLEGKAFHDYLAELQGRLKLFGRHLDYKLLPEARKSFRGAPSVLQGLDDYILIVNSAFKYRLEYPCFELAFCDIDSVGLFHNVVAAIAPQWICQEKPDGGAVIDWHGNKHIVDAIDQIAISTLQSIFHYIQVHVSMSGNFNPTAKIKSVRCPFFGACAVQKDNKFPSECSTRPWDVKLAFSDEGKRQVCFYNSGAKSLYVEASSLP